MDTTTHTPQRPLRSKEAAARYGISEIALRHARCSGVLFGRKAPKFKKLGRTIVYMPNELDEWFEQFESVTKLSDI